MKACYSNFKKIIDTLAPHYGVMRVFDDLLDMIVCALANGRMEDRYLEIVKRYQKNEVECMAKAFMGLILDYEACSDASGQWNDVMGTFYEENTSPSGSQRMGQFFTPVHLCDLMAKLTESSTYSGMTICDPACGSGRNLIAHARLKPENADLCMYYAMDLDRRCVNMTLINMFMYGMRGVVIHCNTLTLEIFAGYRIYAPYTGLGIEPLSIEQCRRYVTTHNDQISNSQTPLNNDENPSGIKPVKAIQMNLF